MFGKAVPQAPAEIIHGLHQGGHHRRPVPVQGGLEGGILRPVDGAEDLAGVGLAGGGQADLPLPPLPRDGDEGQIPLGFGLLQGGVQGGLLEKNMSWITLFIAMAPSLGFLGTVIGMVQAFDKIQQVGDISPTVVAGGMKVALITTIFGLIVALILQVFYNYILSKIEALTSEMEDSSISLLDMVIKYDLKYKK